MFTFNFLLLLRLEKTMLRPGWKFDKVAQLLCLKVYISFFLQLTILFAIGTTIIKLFYLQTKTDWIKEIGENMLTSLNSTALSVLDAYKNLLSCKKVFSIM